MTAPVLEISDLALAAGRTPLVHGVSLAVAPGEAVGIVGESGSGESLTLRAAIGLLPPGVRRTGGAVALREHAGLVLQDPLAALDPLASVGSQLEEVCRTSGGLSRGRARERALELLRLVRIPDPEARRRDLPGALSGGQRQRVVLAIALAARPGILLCDEPTTALDVTVQRQVLDLLAQLRRELGLAMLFVSHDLAVVGEVCSRIVVMREGRVVEEGPTARILTAPRDAYTRMLLDSVLEVPAPAEQAGGAAMSATVEIRDLVVRFRDRVAVDGVSLTIPAGTTLGLVGESGSGKTSLARVVVGMLRPTAGEVLVDGRPVAAGGRAARRAVQMVFQDPNSSLNPRLTVRQALGEALRIAGGVPRALAGERAAELLDLVRLDAGAVLDRVPGELSGGQRQRVAIARAIAAGPDVLVADEPTSALDVSVQAAVLELLASLRQRLGLTVLFISHDLGVVNAVADEVAVMREGRIVEAAGRAEFFAAPRTAYARDLLAAVPRLPASAPPPRPPAAAPLPPAAAPPPPAAAPPPPSAGGPAPRTEPT